MVKNIIIQQIRRDLRTIEIARECGDQSDALETIYSFLLKALSAAERF